MLAGDAEADFSGQWQRQRWLPALAQGTLSLMLIPNPETLNFNKTLSCGLGFHLSILGSRAGGSGLSS